MNKVNAGISIIVFAVSLNCNSWASPETVTTSAVASHSANNVQVEPMRSIIMVSVRDDSDLPAAYRWLYKYHVPDSISQFSPYVTKYATYRALPVPNKGENYGTYNWIMTEHYWMINPFNTSKSAAPNGLAFKEVYSKEYLEITRQPTNGDLRPSHWVGSRGGYHPTVFAFIPMFWEDDFKGSERTIEDGANYRWLIAFKYPEGVSQEEGDKWFRESFATELAKLPEVNRIISSRVLKSPHTSPFQRVAEIWFDNSKQWEKAMAEIQGKVQKPSWAKYDKFPYMEPYRDFVGEFLLDRPESDHLTQYRGYISTR
ncbi:TPA: hypothetical protein ACOVJJ_004393 [Klebsiella oxytoca]